MKKKIFEFVKNKRAVAGATFSFAIVIIFILLMLFAFFSKYFSILILGNRVKETMKEACLYVMTSNWDELYHGIKEGYAGAYNFEGEELLDADRVYDIMQDELETEKYEGEYIKYDENTSEIIYKYYDIEMRINNTGFKNVDDSYNIDLSLKFEVPFKLLTIEYPLKIDLQNKARWAAKY